MRELEKKFRPIARIPSETPGEAVLHLLMTLQFLMAKSGTFLLSAAAVGGLALLLSSCGANRIIPPCPNVRVDNVTANVTQFGDGPGREVGDIVYQAEIVTYDGSCTQDEGNGPNAVGRTEVDLEISLAMATGAGAPQGSLPLYYFVAVPQLFPDAAGKQVFEVRRESRGGAARAERWTERVHLTLPISRERPAAAYDIYVGFQLTDEQLAFNRTRIR